jgi:sugar phosphate isomerase/epimerase
MKTRRDFLKQGTVLSAGMLSAPMLFGGGNKNAKLGIQVYSVRNQLNKDFKGTLKQIAKIGYKNIEAYGLGADGKYLGKVKPAEYKKMCKDLRMNLVSTHVNYFEADDAQVHIDAGLESGLEYLIIPYLSEEMRKTADDYKRIAENLNKVGAICNKAGLKFGYHNHAFEFETVDGQIPMEILIENTDADKVTFEADLFWITNGGFDPIKFMSKYEGRFSCFHVKDANKKLEAETVGKGIIDFASIFASNKKYLKYYFVEDERTDTPIKNITAAYKYLSTADFV